VLEDRCLLSTYTLTDLGTLGGASSYAYGLNNAGQVVGVAQLANLQQHAFVWDNGVMTDLDPNDFTFGGPASTANAINDAGQIVGFGFTPWHAVLWPTARPVALITWGMSSVGRVISITPSSRRFFTTAAPSPPLARPAASPRASTMPIRWSAACPSPCTTIMPLSTPTAPSAISTT
jgi:probable HAF family extracellular repeat protein